MSQNTEAPAIPFSRPRLGPEEEAAVIEVMRSGWLTTGRHCQAFEKDFAQRCGMDHALAVNSATAGLHLALEALGIQAGDRLAVSPYTFTATCEVMRYLGAHPCFIDIAPGSFHLDPERLELALDRAARGLEAPIKAIVPVHIGGVGLHLARIYELAERHGLPVVEDAAHAWPARSAAYRHPLRGGSDCLGSGGTIGVYSFYANKTITTGEGGMVVCRDPALAQRMRTMRLHGIDREVWNRFTSQADQWRYAVVAPGFKYNLTDLAAAIGTVQLGRADGFMAERRSIAAAYSRSFAELPWLELPPAWELAGTDAPRDGHPEPALAHSWHLYTLRLKPAHAAQRDHFARELARRGIGISVHYIPLHIHPYYAETYRLAPGDFPVSLASYEACFSLPIYPGLQDHEIKRVIDTVIAIGAELGLGAP